MSASNQGRRTVLNIAFDPPYASVGSEYRPVVCTVEAKNMGLTDLPSLDCAVIGVHIQPPPRGFHTDFSSIKPLSFLDDVGQTMDAENAYRSVSDNLTTALQRCGQWTTNNPDKNAHFILFVHGPWSMETD